MLVLTNPWTYNNHVALSGLLQKEIKTTEYLRY